ncbi:hypothetical protein J6590_065714 [Homalodisca vitripennis]|nr:hypothetical protein J6590_065714 [Homalodisca vitripennis]
MYSSRPNIDEDRVRKAEKAGEEETKQARKRARMVRKKLIDDDKAKEQDYEAGMFKSVPCYNIILGTKTHLGHISPAAGYTQASRSFLSRFPLQTDRQTGLQNVTPVKCTIIELNIAYIKIKCDCIDRLSVS